MQQIYDYMWGDILPDDVGKTELTSSVKNCGCILEMNCLSFSSKHKFIIILLKTKKFYL